MACPHRQFPVYRLLSTVYLIYSRFSLVWPGKMRDVGSM